MAIENKIRVVIIDDYDMTRMLLRIILEGDHYEVVGEAGDGKEGVEISVKLQPDLILLDVNMPVMNGLEALQKIHLELPGAIVLMVTGEDDVELVNQAILSGASGFIIKPFNSDSVRDTLRDVSGKIASKSPSRLLGREN
ncbi:MAG: response regulator transcription factor [Pseudomonadota bacterium]